MELCFARGAFSSRRLSTRLGLDFGARLLRSHPHRRGRFVDGGRGLGRDARWIDFEDAQLRLSRRVGQGAFGAPRTHSARGDHEPRELNEIGINRHAGVVGARVFERLRQRPPTAPGLRAHRLVLQAGAPAQPASQQKTVNVHPERAVRPLHAMRARSMLQIRSTIPAQERPRPQDRRARTVRRLAPAGLLLMPLQQHALRSAPHRRAVRCSWGPGRIVRLRARRPARRGCRALDGHPGPALDSLAKVVLRLRWAATRRLTSCFQAGKRVAVLADLLNAHFSLPPRWFLRAGSRCRFHSRTSTRSAWNGKGDCF